MFATNNTYSCLCVPSLGNAPNDREASRNRLEAGRRDRGVEERQGGSGDEGEAERDALGARRAHRAQRAQRGVSPRRAPARQVAL